MGEQEYIFDLGASSVNEVCAVIQFYVDKNEGEVSIYSEDDLDKRDSLYAKIEFSLSNGWHGFISFDQLTSYNEQEQRSTITLLTLHGKTTLRITPVVGDWSLFKPHVDKIIEHLLPNGQTVERQPVGAQTKEQPDPEALIEPTTEGIKKLPGDTGESIWWKAFWAAWERWEWKTEYGMTSKKLAVLAGVSEDRIKETKREHGHTRPRPTLPH